MDHQQAQNIIATLKSYSAAAEEALLALGKYDYREEANQWNDHSQPKLLEPEHPTVKGKVDFPQIGFEKGTTERGVSKVSKSC